MPKRSKSKSKAAESASKNGKKKSKATTASSSKGNANKGRAPPKPVIYVCPYTGQDVFIAKATLSDLKRKETYSQSSKKKRLWMIPSQSVRTDCYVEAASALATTEQSLLPSMNSRSWEVEVYLKDPSWGSGSVLFRGWKGNMELAVLPHLLEKIPKPPIWPGKRRNPDEYIGGDDVDLREVSSLSSVAFGLREEYPIPSVHIKWKSPDYKIFHSRTKAWEYAKLMAKREMEIDKHIWGIGSSGKLLQPSVPSAPKTLAIGKLRFERDGLWVIGQELDWQADRPQELEDEREAELERERAMKEYCDEDEEESPEPQDEMTPREFFLQSQRQEYCEKRRQEVPKFTLAKADSELRAMFQALSAEEIESWTQKLEESKKKSEECTGEAPEGATEATETKGDTESTKPKTPKREMTPRAFFLQSKRKEHCQRRRLEDPKCTLVKADSELRVVYKGLSAEEKEHWKQKLEESKTMNVEEKEKTPEKTKGATEKDSTPGEADSKPKAKKRELTPLMFFLQSNRKEHRQKRRLEVPNFSTAKADTELRIIYKGLSAEEKGQWKQKLEDSKKLGGISKDQPTKSTSKPPKRPLTPKLFFLQSKRQEYYQQRLLEDPKLPIAHADNELREMFHELSAGEKAKWKQKLEESKKLAVVPADSSNVCPADNGTVNDNNSQIDSTSSQLRGTSEVHSQGALEFAPPCPEPRNANAVQSMGVEAAKERNVDVVNPRLVLATHESKLEIAEMKRSSECPTPVHIDTAPLQKLSGVGCPQQAMQQTFGKLNATVLSPNPEEIDSTQMDISSSQYPPRMAHSMQEQQAVANLNTAEMKPSNKVDRSSQIECSSLQHRSGSECHQLTQHDAAKLPPPEVTPSLQCLNAAQTKESSGEAADPGEMISQIPITFEAPQEEKKEESVASEARNTQVPTSKVFESTFQKEVTPSADLDVRPTTNATVETLDVVSGAVVTQAKPTKSPKKKPVVSRRKSSGRKKVVDAKTSSRWCMGEEQIKLCYNACVEHYESVMRTVKARDLSQELQDGFDVLRERGRGRFDMELPAFEKAEFDFLTDMSKSPWMPVVRQILGDDVVLIHKGSFLSMPGAEHQVYHQDGVHLTTQTQRPCHAINVFVPLVDLDNRNGPTEFCLGSHILGHEGYDRDFCYTPKPKAGVPVIFDYRLGHRGLGNSSQSCRPIVYCTYARATDGKDFRDSANFSRKRYHKIGELLEKPLSREERRSNRKRSLEQREEGSLKREKEELEKESEEKKAKLFNDAIAMTLASESNTKEISAQISSNTDEVLDDVDRESPLSVIAKDQPPLKDVLSNSTESAAKETSSLSLSIVAPEAMQPKPLSAPSIATGKVVDPTVPLAES